MTPGAYVIDKDCYFVRQDWSWEKSFGSNSEMMRRGEVVLILGTLSRAPWWNKSIQYYISRGPCVMVLTNFGAGFITMTSFTKISTS